MSEARLRVIVKDDRKAWLEGKSNLEAVKAWTALPGERWISGGKMMIHATEEVLKGLKEKYGDDVEIITPQGNTFQFEQDAMKESSLPPRYPQFEWREPDETTPPDYTGPRGHQKRAFELANNRDWFALFMDMGTGKTYTAIHLLAEWWRTNRINTAIIVAPNGVHLQWLNEQLTIWMPKWVKWIGCEIKTSKPPPTEWLRTDYGTLRIAVTNIETLSSGFGESRIKELLKKSKTALIMDESTRIKTPGSERTKTALRLSKLTQKRLILSGQPVTKGIEDLYSQCKFLSPFALNQQNFTAFKAYYCLTGGWEGKKIVGYQRLDDLLGQLSKFSIVVRREDCLDLPPKNYITHQLDMDTAQKKAYRSIKEELVVVLNEIKELRKKADEGPMDEDTRQRLIVTAANAASGLIRMQQIACGWVPVDDIEDEGVQKIVEFNRDRAHRSVELALEAPGKAIIFTRFRHCVKIIHEILTKQKIGHRTYYGDMKMHERQESLALFKEDEDTKILVGTGAAGGIGLNLAHASTMIYHANDFNFETRDQSEARIWRMGQTQKVLYCDLIAAPIDRMILKTLGERRSVADAVRLGLINPEDL